MKIRGMLIPVFSVLFLILSTVQSSVARESAAPAQPHVVSGSEIQAAMDRQRGQEDADRLAIRLLLQRPEVQKIAGSAGLDLKRADAAAAVLSGPELAELAARSQEVNELAGGDSVIIISATTVIIVLLLLILLTD